MKLFKLVWINTLNKKRGQGSWLNNVSENEILIITKNANLNWPTIKHSYVSKEMQRD